MRGDMQTLRDLITKVNNCAFVYGCEPALGVNADTNMASDIQQAFLERYNKNNLELLFPDVLDHL